MRVVLTSKNFPRFFSIVSLLVALLFVSPPLEAQEIGQGYTCDGTTILNKRNKTVKLSVAKSKIQEKIDALGNSKKDKDKRKALNAVKKSLIACSQGTFSPDNGGGSSDVAGTYSGILTRTSDASESSRCEDRASINSTFPVQVSGSTIKVDGSINPFHIPVTGKAKGSGFELTGKKTGVELTLTVTNVTDTSADFAAVTSASVQGRKVCEVTYSGVGFTRVQ